MSTESDRVIVVAAPGLCRRYFTGLYLRGRDRVRHFALDPDDKWVLRFESCPGGGVGDELFASLRRENPEAFVDYSSLYAERRWYQGSA